MALCSQQLQRFLLNKIYIDYSHNKSLVKRPKYTVKSRQVVKRLCSAIAIDAPSSLAGVSGIRWGSVKLKGARDEMEDDIVIVRLDDHDGFCFAAVFDGHAGFSSVEFLREELYRECVTSLQGGKLLKSKDSKAIKKALQDAFENTDAKLLNWLETRGEKDESGSTVTAVFLKDDVMFISHVGDSSVVMSRSGKAEVLTESHRPYGNKKASLQEIKRIREAGGWITNGRICGDISVSRAFGDIRFKTKKNEMLKKGVDQGLWSQKFASRIEFRGDLITATPDVSQIAIGSDAEFVVLASDGLWDYINSSEAVSFVRSHLRQHGNVQMASEALAQLALNRRSQDNISVAIADLGRTDWRNLPVERQNVAYELAQALATVALVSAGIWVSTLLSS